MFPGPAMTGWSPHTNPNNNMNDEGQTLSRLAEIAAVVSRQQQPPQFTLPMMGAVNNLATGGYNVAMATAFRKRPSDFAGLSTSLSTVVPSRDEANKRPKLASSRITTNNTNTNTNNRPSPDADDTANGDDLQDVRFREYQAEIWSEKFEDLCEFRRQYGHCHVPHTYAENAALAQWVKRQRYQHKLKSYGKRSTLSEERIRLLDQIGFIWNSHDVVWEDRWYELMAFKKVHGHCVVPSNYEKNPQLAVWVKRQRRQFKFYQEKKPTSLTPERIAKLDKLGFAWDCRKTAATQGNMGGSKGGGGSNCEDTTDDDGTTSETNNSKEDMASTTTAPIRAMAVAAKKSIPNLSQTKMNGDGVDAYSGAAGLTVESVLRLGGFSGPKLPGVTGSTKNHRTVPALKIFPFKNVRTASKTSSNDAMAVSQVAETFPASQVAETFPAAGVTHDSSSANNNNDDKNKHTLSEAATATLSSLPYEFFSSSKLKFTKFPKINLNK